ncbi:MAG: IS1595 family transposase [Beijerinckiaceae bacterium]|nr:MAG: IS1595 family transposase [Beijerinckiaceae bacterium]
MSVLSKPYFHDEAKAFEYLEGILWPQGPVCPHCGSVSGKHYDLRKTRVGLRKCSDCRKQFTVKVGTVFESAHIPLNKMLQAVYLMTSSKKGISAHQLHRVLEITYKSAWFLAHRIREAMRSGELSPLGGAGKTVEIDETFIGRLADVPKQRHGYAHKNVVLTLVERGGAARSWHVDGTTVGTLIPIIRANVAHETAMMTDQASWYKNLNKNGEFASHDSVDHSRDEYARYEASKVISTNTVEGYYSIFKRGMKGVYQHCGEKHLHRYLAEFDFRYSNRVALGCGDQERSTRALSGIVGKRLTYRGTDSVANA